MSAWDRAEDHADAPLWAKCSICAVVSAVVVGLVLLADHAHPKPSLGQIYYRTDSGAQHWVFEDGRDVEFAPGPRSARNDITLSGDVRSR